MDQKSSSAVTAAGSPPPPPYSALPAEFATANALPEAYDVKGIPDSHVL